MSLLGAASIVFAGAVPIVQVVSGAPQASAAGLPPLTTPAVPVCGVAYPNGGPAGTYETPAVASSSPSPSATITKIRSAPPYHNMTGGLYSPVTGDVYERTVHHMVVLSTSGTVLHDFSLPTAATNGASLTVGNTNGAIVAGLNGNIYFYMMSNGPVWVVKINGSTGALEWGYDTSVAPGAMFPWHDASGGWALAVPATGGLLLSPSGAVVSGTFPSVVAPNFVTPTPSGGLIYGDVASQGYYVSVDNSDGKPVPASATDGVPRFGYSLTGQALGQQPGDTFGFYTPGGVVEVGSTIYVTDSDGIDVFSDLGVLEGIAPASALGSMGPYSMLYYDASSSSLIFNNYYGIVSVPLSQVQALASYPQTPPAGIQGDHLGIGAGLTTPAKASYFAPGTTPSVTATFDPWWRAYPDPLDLSYQVISAEQATSDSLPVPTSVPLSWSGVSSGSPLEIPLSVSTGPGTYLVNADLVDTTTGDTIGSTCLTYSVGMAGDKLDFSTLPTTYPASSVQLAADLGTGLYRGAFGFSSLLPSCSASPSASTCGPSAFDWSKANLTNLEAAASQAKADKVNFELLMTGGGATARELVSGGYWQEDIEAVAEYLHAHAPDITYLEVWNEPGYSPSYFVTDILKPFYEGVQAANAADGGGTQVVGPTLLGTSSAQKSWWTGFAQADGFSYLDVVAFHPYPGYDRSFEEQGSPAYVSWLKSLMAANGAGSDPLWVTEMGWFQYGGEQTFYNVGNWAARQWMWLKSLGVTGWNYYTLTNTYGAFALIPSRQYVTPGAIGLMTASTILGDRPFLKMVPTGIPHAYAMLFGPPASGSSANDVLAVWTDDLKTDAVVSVASGNVTMATTGALGQPGSLSVSASSPATVQLSGAPLYLHVPSGVTVSVAPPVPFSQDLAKGMAATASTYQSSNPPSYVVLGTANALGNGGVGSTPVWASLSSDTSPWVEVSFAHPETLDRVIVAGSSISSVMPGLRDYSVELSTPSGWVTVGSVTNAYWQRMHELTFSPVSDVTAVKVSISAVNYSDIVGGLPPAWWSLASGAYAAVYSVEAYSPAKPAPPQSLTASAVSSQVSLSWSPPASDGGATVTGYDIYQGTAAGQEATTPVNSSPLSATAYTVKSLTDGQAYYFTVKAVNVMGSSPASSEVSATPVATPSAPRSLTASAGDSQVSLGWSPPTSNGGATVTGYDIYQGVAAGQETATPVNSSPLSATAYTVKGLTNGQAYYFTVKAVNSAGLSPASNEASATPVAPSTPTTTTTTLPPVTTTTTVPPPPTTTTTTLPPVTTTTTVPPPPTTTTTPLPPTTTPPVITLVTTTTTTLPPVTTTTTPRAPGPRVFRISPSSWPSTGGGVVTVVGSDLCSVQDVLFGQEQAKVEGTGDSCEKLTVTVPPGSGTVPVVLLGAGRRYTAQVEFTYTKPGYWVATSGGAVHAYGGAKFHGSMSRRKLAAPIVAIVATPGMKGYWLVGADGGVFSFGNAHFYGSVPEVLGPHRHLGSPIVSAAAAPGGRGYWLVSADGGVFSFGRARFAGSLGGRRTVVKITRIVPAPGGDGYWLVGKDAKLFAFGDASHSRPGSTRELGSQLVAGDTVRTKAKALGSSGARTSR